MLKESLLFETVADRYIKFVLQTRTTDQTREIFFMEYWKTVFKGRDVRQIVTKEIAEAKDRLLMEIQSRLTTRSSGKSNGSIMQNRYIARLKHFFGVVTDDWGLRDTNPTNKIKLNKPNQPREVFKSTAEILKILVECAKSKNKKLYLAVQMIVSSGARKSEVLNLTFDQINYETCSARLPKTKNSKAGTLYFNEEIMIELRKYRRTTGNIFNISSINRGFNAAVARAGLPPMHIHDLRHTFASHLAMSGESTLKIKEALRVSSMSMVSRYAHLAPENVSITVKNISKHWKISPEERGWIFEEGVTLIPKV